MTRRDIFKLLASIPGVSLLPGVAKANSIVEVAITGAHSAIEPVCRIRADYFSLLPDAFEAGIENGYRTFTRKANPPFECSGRWRSGPIPRLGDSVNAFEVDCGYSPVVRYTFSAIAQTMALGYDGEIQITGRIYADPQTLHSARL